MYDDFTKEILKKNLEISEESLKILKGMRRARRINMLFTVFKWAVIIVASLGIYYYIEPYLQNLIDTLNAFSSSANEIKNLLPR